MTAFGCGFAQAYGMTETAGTVVMLPPEDHATGGSRRMRAAAKALPGVELKIVDGDGQPLLPGQAGEIVIRLSNNMLGYWKQPEASARTQSADGWVSTGDAGTLDADGYRNIHDRLKDMTISGGENIDPAEVESGSTATPAWPIGR